MTHCNQCGTKVRADANFCQNCGIDLKSGLTQKAINANLKVALRNETTEKVLKELGNGISSGITGFNNIFKKLIKPLIIITIIASIAAGAVFYYEERNRSVSYEKYEKERKKKEADKINFMTFNKEKAIGTFQIKGLALNSRFLSYYEGGDGYYQEKYSDSWPYDGDGTIYDQRPTGKVTIYNNQIIIYIDLNRDNKFSSTEKTEYEIKSISKSDNPELYNIGIIETGSGKKIWFSIILDPNTLANYILHYKINEDIYELWLQ